MPLDTHELVTLSRLLDEALDLPGAQARAAWLACLSPEHTALKPVLAEMLAEHERLREADPLRPVLPALLGALAPPDPSVASAGERIGPYRLLREIGRGGMGTVWLAERADGVYQREVALKLPRLAWGAGLARRMAREREIGALLEHPAIARLYDAGVDEHGRPYLAFEYIAGHAIDAWCNERALAAAERLRLLAQVARAVAYAHGRLVVHRDIKPSNVLVDDTGQVHLLDFGIAKRLQEGGGDEHDAGLTQELGRVLTPRYASPEQLQGQAITVQSDVYSLGVLGHELLTGQPLHAARRSNGSKGLDENAADAEPPLASQCASTPAQARALRGDIDAILAKALRRDSTQRYGSADAMADDIERHLAGQTISARLEGPLQRLLKVWRRHWVGASATAVGIVALLVSGTVALQEARRASDAAQSERLVREFIAEMFRASTQAGLHDRSPTPGNPRAELVDPAPLIEARFTRQPMLRADLYGALGAMYADIGVQRMAVQYSERHLDALLKAHATNDLLARASMLLADVFRRAGRFDAAAAKAREAVALSGADSLLGFEAQALLAELLDDNGKTEDSRRMVAELAGTRWARVQPATLGAARIAYIQARASFGRGQVDDAIRQYRLAIDRAVGAEGQGSYWANTIRARVARSLIENRRETEAFALYDEAMRALSAAGDAGRIRAAVLSASFWQRADNARIRPHEEARQAILASLRTLSGYSSTLPPEVPARVELALGALETSFGNVQEGAQRLEASVPVVLDATDKLDMHYFGTLNLGYAEMAVGKHAAADSKLREALLLRRNLGSERSPFAAYDWASVALNLVMQGHLADADRALAMAPEFPAFGSAPSGAIFAQAVPRAKARIALARGDAKRALELLPPADLAFEEDARTTAMALYAIRGEAWCAQGRTAEGLPLLERWIATVMPLVSDNDPGLARVRSVAGLCALQAGDRRAAGEEAARARAAFTAQPDVSPYFKAPWAELERRLPGPGRGARPAL